MRSNASIRKHTVIIRDDIIFTSRMGNHGNTKTSVYTTSLWSLSLSCRNHGSRESTLIFLAHSNKNTVLPTKDHSTFTPLSFPLMLHTGCLIWLSLNDWDMFSLEVTQAIVEVCCGNNNGEHRGRHDEVARWPLWAVEEEESWMLFWEEDGVQRRGSSLKLVWNCCSRDLA